MEEMGGEQWPPPGKARLNRASGLWTGKSGPPAVIYWLGLSPQCFGGRPVITYTVPFADACPLTVPSTDAVPNSVPSVA